MAPPATSAAAAVRPSIFVIAQLTDADAACLGLRGMAQRTLARASTSIPSPARSLGLASVTAVRKQKSYLVVDPSRAVQDTLDRMPRRAPADLWFRHLCLILPVLGAPDLVSALPGEGVSSTDASASTALAVQKLERAGRVRLVASDDASSAVVLRLGSRDRHIAEVHLVEGAA